MCKMLRKFTCIVCPNGCEVEVDIAEGDIAAITGAACPKGETYVRQELAAPQRNIATSILVKGGTLPLASVRLTKPIPKKEIWNAMEEIKKITIQAPVKAGTTVIENLLGLGSDVIVTKTVGRRQR